MDFIQDTELPEIIKKHLESSVSKAWKFQESTAFLNLSNEFGSEKVINAFGYLKSNGIPPYGEVSTEPLSFLAAHNFLITAFNVGYKASTKAPEFTPEIQNDLI